MFTHLTPWTDCSSWFELLQQLKKINFGPWDQNLGKSKASHVYLGNKELSHYNSVSQSRTCAVSTGGGGGNIICLTDHQSDSQQLLVTEKKTVGAKLFLDDTQNSIFTLKGQPGSSNNCMVNTWGQWSKLETP